MHGLERHRRGLIKLRRLEHLAHNHSPYHTLLAHSHRTANSRKVLLRSKAPNARLYTCRQKELRRLHVRPKDTVSLRLHHLLEVVEARRTILPGRCKDLQWLIRESADLSEEVVRITHSRAFAVFEELVALKE